MPAQATRMVAVAIVTKREPAVGKRSSVGVVVAKLGVELGGCEYWQRVA